MTTTESYSSTFAMKVLSKTAMEANGVLLCDAYREIEIALSRAAQHAAIVRHSRAIESASSLYLLMEPVAGGDLGQLINKAPYGMLGHGTSVRASLWWSEALAARLFQQLLAALAHLHAAGVVHLDVKPSNALLSEAPPNKPLAPLRSARGMALKLCDFGFAHRVGTAAGAGRRFREPNGAPRVFGTPEYCAPEMLRGAPVGVAADCWSAGVILYYLLCGERPCNVRPATMKADLAVLQRGEFPTSGEAASEVWEFVSAEAKGLMAALTLVAPAKRRSAAAALSHDWLAAVPATPPTGMGGGGGVIQDGSGCEC